VSANCVTSDGPSTVKNEETPTVEPWTMSVLKF